MEIIFEHPAYLVLLLSLPLLWLSHYYFLRNIKRKAIKFANFEALKRVTGSTLITNNNMVLLIRLATLALFVVSAAGPVFWYKGDVNTNDYVIALDTSASMLAEDIPPDRLRAAKQVALEFMDTLDVKTQVGIVTFAGIPHVESLLTSNLPYVKSKIEDAEIMVAGGTDIGSALITSTNVLLLGRKSKTIILLTDGTQTTGSFVEDGMQAGIAYAHRNHVIIHPIGIGTKEGIAGYLPMNLSASYDSDVLKGAASSTGGRYFEAVDSASLRSAFEEIALLKEEAYVSTDLRFGLLMIGLILLFVEWGMINTRYRAVP